MSRIVSLSLSPVGGDSGPLRKKRQRVPSFFTVRHSSDEFVVTSEAFIANALRRLDARRTLDT